MPSSLVLTLFSNHTTTTSSQVDFNKYSKDLNEIYDLYDAEAELTEKDYA
jgi:hypothetical protein